MSTKLQLTISDEAMEIINANATERKRGEWLSNAVVEYDRLMTGKPSVAPDDNGLLERIDARLAHVERQLAVVIQRAWQDADRQ